MPAPDGQDDRLAALVDAVVRLAGGDLEARIEPSPARDDIDAVIMGFNLMAEELGSVHLELEQRVRSRTAMLHQAHREMERMSLTDPLTSLSNRRALVAAIAREVGGAGPGGRLPVLLLLDLDSFKSVNDSLGHNAGDEVLKTVARRLRGAVRAGDVVARLGGDEFAVLLPGATMAAGRRVANRIARSLRESVTVDGREFTFGASVGAALAVPGQSADDLLMQADTAMYTAKADPRENVVVFDPVLLFARRRRSQLAAELRAGVRGNELVLAYQPVVELATGRIEGVEALVRWNHPERGLLMPDEFIPLAEETGAMVELGRWVLRSALRQLRQWQDEVELPEDFSLRINVSASELQQLDFLDTVRSALAAADIQPSNLILELTESSLVRGNDLDTYSLLGLRNLGVRLEIDDFGTGYSSISYLRRLPVDVVKIDRSLVSEVGTDPGQREFIAAILQLVRACGMEAVFEGVETQEQARVLTELGCVSAQGYYFSRPEPPQAVARLLAVPPHLRIQPSAPFPAP